MGIFQEMKSIRNLTDGPLTVRFDGQEITIPSGVSDIPAIAVSYAMNQNPVMGSADAWNPNISGARYLIVPVGSKYDRAPLTETELVDHAQQPCRVNTQGFFADRLGPNEHVAVRGKGRKTQAKSLYDAGVRISTAEVITEAR